MLICRRKLICKNCQPVQVDASLLAAKNEVSMVGQIDNCGSVRGRHKFHGQGSVTKQSINNVDTEIRWKSLRSGRGIKVTKQFFTVIIETKPLPIESFAPAVQTRSCACLVYIQLIDNIVNNDLTMADSIGDPPYGYANEKRVTQVVLWIVVSEYAIQRALRCWHDNRLQRGTNIQHGDFKSGR